MEQPYQNSVASGVIPLVLLLGASACASPSVAPAGRRSVGAKTTTFDAVQGEPTKTTTFAEDLDGDGSIDRATFSGSKLTIRQWSVDVGSVSSSLRVGIIDIDTKDRLKEVLVMGECPARPGADETTDPCAYYLFSFRDGRLCQFINPASGTTDFSQYADLFSDVKGNGRLRFYAADCGSSRTLILRLSRSGVLSVESEQSGITANKSCR